MASGSGRNLLACLVGVVVRRYNIDFLILLIPTPLASVLFFSSIPTFCSLKKKVSFVLYNILRSRKYSPVKMFHQGSFQCIN